MICDLVGGGTRGLNIVQLGKEHGEEAIEHYTDSKSVVIATESQSEMVAGE